MLRILGICGRLRKGSYNASLLRADEERAAPDTTIQDVRQLALTAAVGALRCDKDGKLTHQGSQRLVLEQLDALIAFVERVRWQRSRV
jgi:NAD(P)H-dependent FMN reductase